MCDSVYPLKEGLPPRRENRRPVQENAHHLSAGPRHGQPAFQHIKLVMTMFEGDTPLKIRLADSGKLLGAKCLNHPAFVQECREWLGPENVVVKTAFTGK